MEARHYTPEEAREMARLSKGSLLRCAKPACSSSKVKVSSSIKSMGTPDRFHLLCQACGTTGEHQEPARRHPYTREQMLHIAKTYQTEGYAACPDDQFPLTTQPSHTQGRNYRLLSAVCPFCGGIASTDGL